MLFFCLSSTPARHHKKTKKRGRAKRKWFGQIALLDASILLCGSNFRVDTNKKSADQLASLQVFFSSKGQWRKKLRPQFQPLARDCKPLILFGTHARARYVFCLQSNRATATRRHPSRNARSSPLRAKVRAPCEKLRASPWKEKTKSSRVRICFFFLSVGKIEGRIGEEEKPHFCGGRAFTTHDGATPFAAVKGKTVTNIAIAIRSLVSRC